MSGQTLKMFPNVIANLVNPKSYNHAKCLLGPLRFDIFGLFFVMRGIHERRQATDSRIEESANFSNKCLFRCHFRHLVMTLTIMYALVVGQKLL